MRRFKPRRIKRLPKKQPVEEGPRMWRGVPVDSDTFQARPSLVKEYGNHMRVMHRNKRRMRRHHRTIAKRKFFFKNK